MIHVLIGTKAQYIKTAPVLRRLDAEGIPCRLIDSGQHAGLAGGLRRELGIREPDHLLRRGDDIDTAGRAAVWLGAGLLRAALFPGRVRRELFAGAPGVCVVHGDTPSTLLGAFSARRAGLAVAHLEAGLRSHSYVNPFPEELIRVMVMRGADILFVSSDRARREAEALRPAGRVVHTGENTSVESLAYALGRPPSGAVAAVSTPEGTICLVAVHRVETLHRRRRMEEIVRLVERIAGERPVVFVVHPPTKVRLAKYGLDRRLGGNPRVTLLPLVPHTDFLHLMQRAAFVVTDGGSVQEESYYLDVPCLLLRMATEREEGLGGNVLLSKFDPAVIEGFLGRFASFRAGRRPGEAAPSAVIVEHQRS